MMSIIVRLAANVLALWLAAWLVPGFDVQATWQQYAIAGVALGLLNLIVKPIVKMIAFPLIILTLGLFSLAINGAILWAVDYYFVFIDIQTWTALALGTLVVSIVNMLFSHKS
jgi:putative membrane protein